MQFSLKLLDSNSYIKKQILNAIAITLDKAFIKSMPNIQNKIREQIRQALISEPEYSSLISGKLKYEFGIPTSSQVNNIIDLWIKNIVVSYRKPSAGTNVVSGGFSISAIQSDYSDVISSSDAIVVDSVSGAVLPWLEWLLLYGGKVIVKNYRVKMGPNPRSRTNMAIMVESTGANWRVPPEFAGTQYNNWLTRALSKIEDKIPQIIKAEIGKSL